MSNAFNSADALIGYACHLPMTSEVIKEGIMCRVNAFETSFDRIASLNSGIFGNFVNYGSLGEMTVKSVSRFPKFIRVRLAM